MTSTASTELYNVPVDPDAPNTAHGFALAMIGTGKRVLELGCGHGNVTRVLSERGNTVVAIELDPVGAATARSFATSVVELDLDRADVRDHITGPFDVVLLGDVLEHLRDPWSTLDQVIDLLGPEGCVILSIPNVNHIDFQLSHLAGEWTYRPTGLLDRTHLRFFTLDTMRQMLGDAGLVELRLDRVHQPAFSTDLAVDPTCLPEGVVDHALKSPEAETYQFVMKAVPADQTLVVAQAQRRQLEEQNLDLRLQINELEQARTDLESRFHITSHEHGILSTRVVELEAAQAELAHAHAALTASAAAEAERLRHMADEARQHGEALEATMLFRAAAPLRKVYGRARRTES